MLRREKRQSEKDSEEPRESRRKEVGQSSEAVPKTGSDIPAAITSPTSSPKKVDTNADDAEDTVEHSMSSSPMKNQIDLNIQPEREEDQSPKSDAVGALRLPRNNPT
jgi:hypothetical protein